MFSFICAMFACLSLMAQGNLVGLKKISNPDKETAREFFNWDIQTFPVYDGFGNVIPDYSQFKSSKGHTLHVGNATYNPAQPIIAYDKVTSALDTLGLGYAVSGVGEFDSGRNIFAQFDITGDSGKESQSVGWAKPAGSAFTVNGKEYKGLITMAKGSDKTLPLCIWLTIICIVCQNTFRMALSQRKGQRNGDKSQGISVSIRQTKNSGKRVDTLDKQIMALFGLQESVQETLQKMSQTPVTLNEAERAFLGLLKPLDGEKVDMSQTGKTRTANTLERYLGAFKDSPGVYGKTREDWLNAVSYVDTHGNEKAKKFDAAKQFVSSEFGTSADRKTRAFAMASETEHWDKLVMDGESIMSELLTRKVTLSSTPTALTSEFSRLLEKA